VIDDRELFRALRTDLAGAGGAIRLRISRAEEPEDCITLRKEYGPVDSGEG
jgi:hypothetical protein